MSNVFIVTGQSAVITAITQNLMALRAINGASEYVR